MCAVLVVVANVFSHESIEMTLVEDDDVIEQISPTVANESFSNTILPRTLETGPPGNNVESLDSVFNLVVEIGSLVKN